MRKTVWEVLEGARLCNGKIAVITGAASGIGRACARMFAHQGGSIVLADLKEAAAKRVCGEIRSRGGQAVSIGADITREEDCDRIFQAAAEAYGGIDVLINAAGGGLPTDFFEIGTEEWNKIVQLNLTSVFLMSQRAAAALRKRGGGAIVNISSIAGRSVSTTAGCHYTASKAGVLGLTRHMASSLARYGIRINAVCPGTIGSERIMQRLEAQGRIEQAIQSIPLGRIGDVDDVASCCLFLASDLSSYITGATLDVNGGLLTI
jgi:NAD(P)-dependent dehydrogenase (short-subunit alcohol dehydrogenase family)